MVYCRAAGVDAALARNAHPRRRGHRSRMRGIPSTLNPKSIPHARCVCASLSHSLSLARARSFSLSRARSLSRSRVVCASVKVCCVLLYLLLYLYLPRSFQIYTIVLMCTRIHLYAVNSCACMGDVRCYCTRSPIRTPCPRKIHIGSQACPPASRV